ncbi:hypothetical protein XM38_002570 [Halomicronema hongdechloris C2206]|uniref:Uncharacterized protein n=1 Tax=Halomicronema hongdechloris C2206 TaxID=1641165 RepID=A0A1Z3HGA1_9CYAN|nr:DUF6544 family protein [Halomicronema hongdechloris]ASC69330.1 hypothetical protein XM38_002570 [Halomicronema hongdechloris C2206]
MLTLIVILVIILALALGIVRIYGAYRWQQGTQTLRTQLEQTRVPRAPQPVDLEALGSLPAPVEQYLHTVLQPGQPLVTAVRVQHQGHFNLGTTADRWQPFTSEQRVVIQRPGFDWDACISLLPGVPIYVHDAYVVGEGLLQVALLGCFPLLTLRGPGDLAQGELMRFLAEAAWYPTALLPGQGVQWKTVDQRCADATLTDGAVTVILRFRFTDQGLIDTVQAEARGRLVDGETIPTPWQGRFWHYEQRGPMRVPLAGEVAWLLPEGPKPYWRGCITRLTYELAD